MDRRRTSAASRSPPLRSVGAFGRRISMATSSPPPTAAAAGTLRCSPATGPFDSMVRWDGNALPSTSYRTFGSALPNRVGCSAPVTEQGDRHRSRSFERRMAAPRGPSAGRYGTSSPEDCNSSRPGSGGDGRSRTASRSAPSTAVGRGTAGEGPSPRPAGPRTRSGSFRPRSVTHLAVAMFGERRTRARR